MAAVAADICAIDPVCFIRGNVLPGKLKELQVLSMAKTHIIMWGMPKTWFLHPSPTIAMCTPCAWLGLPEVDRMQHQREKPVEGSEKSTSCC